MATLETQINQIFLSPTESKKLSLILYEEKLSASQHLYFIAELRGIQKKTEINDLSRISEIIIAAFKKNKKMPADSLFENTLAEINNELAEFAHKGRKSWLGKFSALIALRADRDFYLANSGHTCAWLKRKNNLNELLNAEKTETHPLKTFINFSSGRLIEGDSLILMTSSIFNYISLELLSKSLNSHNLQECCTKISDILRTSAKSDGGFAVFMLDLIKKTVTAAETPNAKKSEPVIRSDFKYAPMPEELKEEASQQPTVLSSNLSWIKIPNFKFSWPKFNFNLNFNKLPRVNFLPSVSGPAKFFLASFILFAILFALNIAAYGVRKAQSKHTEQFNQIAEGFVNLLADAESSLLYKNQSQAMKLISSAETELHKLQQLDSKKSVNFQAKFEEMNNKVNRVTILRNVTAAFEMPYTINFIARAGDGYLMSNENPNSLSMYVNDEFKNLFMLNKIDSDVTGVAHASGQGNFVAGRDKIYRANDTTKEFGLVSYISNDDLSALKFVDPNRLYAINKNTNNVIRMTASGNTLVGTQPVLKTNSNLQFAQDLAIDADIYVLFPDHVKKYVNGNLVEFILSPISEPAKKMTKIRVGAQIYLLEPVASRVLIYSKKGELLNQVQFPELTDLKDIYIDEAQREMLLVNNNKVYRITF